MRLFTKILLAITIYSQMSLAANTFKINVCRAPLRDALGPLANSMDPEKLEDYQYWFTFSHNFPTLSPEIKNIDLVSSKVVINNKANVYINRNPNYKNTVCETIFETSDRNQYNNKYSTITTTLEDVNDEFPYYGLNKSDKYEYEDIFRTSKWRIKEALYGIGKEFPVAFSDPVVSAAKPQTITTIASTIQRPVYTIEVRAIPLRISQNLDIIPDVLKHYWVVALKDGVKDFVGNFEAKTDPQTIVQVLAGYEVDPVVNQNDVIHADVERVEVFRTFNEQEYNNALDHIKLVYKNSSSEYYHILSNNCGIIAHRAISVAGIKWTLGDINAMSYTPHVIGNIERTIEEPSLENILDAGDTFINVVCSLILQ